ncbi:MAG: FAD-dependent oxidoreductase [Nitrospinota bacterium]|nr:FAD-dependent oxidoreductase [Nitrospinota bacterium]
MRNVESFDFVIFGGGIFGLFAANLLGKKGLKVCLIELGNQVFSRASCINPARVHQGYHYPRSLSTAITSAKYFKRFLNDFSAAINKKFKKIYAIANRSSFTSSKQFLRFCEFCNIPAKPIDPSLYFNSNTVEGAYESEEFAFDPTVVKEILLENNKEFKNLTYFFDEQLTTVQQDKPYFKLDFISGLRIKSQGVFNCTYASVNQILDLFGFDLFDIKYEICEVALCSVDEKMKNLGITMMDGPFFSIMPYGKNALHTLTAVEFTPRKTSSNSLPNFSCQNLVSNCTPNLLQNCNTCPSRPESSYMDMRQLAYIYLKPEFQIAHKESLFAIKPILRFSEVDDSRPTIVQTYSEEPKFITVLSGKANAIYELEEIINAI